MILFAISMHYLWAIALLADPAAINATNLLIFETAFGIHAGTLAGIFLIVASMSLLSMTMPFGRYSIRLMLPQQFTMMISAYGALVAIASGHFGDGIQRPEAFIFADQSYAVLAAIGHTLAILGRVGGAFNGYPPEDDEWKG